MDIHKELILIRNNQTQEFEDKTAAIDYFKYEGNKLVIGYADTNKTYNYNPANAIWLKDPKKISRSDNYMF